MKLLRWLLFLGFLFLLGFGLWWALPVQPRFTVPRDGEVGGISDDGRRLYLIAGLGQNRSVRSSWNRVEIWDTVAGRIVKQIPNAGFARHP